MARRHRIGIVGIGALTTETILPHLAQPDFQARAELAALCDIVPGRARASADQYGVPLAYEDHREMLERADLDAVFVITDTRSHAPIAIDAMRAGKHVYIQKPTADTDAQADALVATVEETGVKCVCAPGQVLWPLYRRIGRKIREGAIGTPFVAVPPMLGWGGLHMNFPTDPRHFFGPVGGPLRDHGGYAIQMLATMFGPVRRVTAMGGIVERGRTWNGQPIPVESPDNTAVLMEFEGGVLAMMQECWSDSSPHSCLFHINGTEGSIDGWPNTVNELKVFSRGATILARGEVIPIEFHQSEVDSIRLGHERFGHVHVYTDILHLLDCIDRDELPLADIYRGRHMVEVINAAFRAMETGQTQPVRSTLGPIPTPDW